MKSQESSLTLGSTSLTDISIFELEDQEAVEGTLELIRKNYTSLSIEDKKGIKITLKDILCTVEVTQEKNCHVLSTSISHLSDDSKGGQRDLEGYRRQTQPILDMLPSNPIMKLSIFVAATGSQDEALDLVRQYSEYVGNHKAAVGMVSNCLLATFRMTAGETDSPSLKMLLFPVNPEEKHAISDLLADIKHLAINLANLNKLYRLCQPYFPQVDPGETEIQEKIEVILNRMRQTEPVGMETLKLWLSDVMDRFSTLSILSGLIKRDQITARTYIEENKNLLNRWGEIGLERYPTNTLMETIEYNAILQPFKDFIDRTQSLRAQLETVSDMVRTYLGIRQQEQSSEILKQQVKMLRSIEGHERILKALTWWVVIFTITLVTLEVLRLLDILA